MAPPPTAEPLGIDDDRRVSALKFEAKMQLVQFLLFAVAAYAASFLATVWKLGAKLETSSVYQPMYTQSCMFES